jgi:hypothetical protein
LQCHRFNPLQHFPASALDRLPKEGSTWLERKTQKERNLVLIISPFLSKRQKPNLIKEIEQSVQLHAKLLTKLQAPQRPINLLLTLWVFPASLTIHQPFGNTKDLIFTEEFWVD